MTQYCRYCSLASLQDDDLIYCEARKEIRDKRKLSARTAASSLNLIRLMS